MPKKYIKKVEVVNASEFARLEIDPAKLGLSQRTYTDKLMTFLEPLKAKAKYEEAFDEIILEFVERTNGQSKDLVRSWYRTFTNLEVGNEEWAAGRRVYLWQWEDTETYTAIARIVKKGMKKRMDQFKKK